ncbi:MULTISPECIES: glycoside hydrolase family 36 protein [Arthrobacter]|uniref:Alpha-galactosidase n=1 Tax=Arthrobacter terricola TaxID=2547396 RepID=A0A4R5KEP1_9MICC|nr:MULTISPECIES: glycoside hydrolase family 36 protein [Arthrobacter]TDF93696.1 alpha-galactosidase [Arthrobacter terricola]
MQSTPGNTVVEQDAEESAAAGPFRFEWNTGRLRLNFIADADLPVVLSGISDSGSAWTNTRQPIVELMATGDGRARTTTRFTNTGVGARLRYEGHSTRIEDGTARLDVVQRDPLTGLEVTTFFSASPELAASRVTTTVMNTSGTPVILEAVSSFSAGAFVYPGESTKDLLLHSGTGEQLAEFRWTTEALWSQDNLADFNSANMNQPGRGGVEKIGTSTWSTARALPTGALENKVTGRSFAWQIEHNGGWRWEVDNIREDEDSVALVLLGPEDLDHHWSHKLEPGESFMSVPVSFAVSGAGFEGVIAELTRHRRWLRRRRHADAGSVLVFNDYMNTINGDPTTEKLLPLIEQAAAAGAECFCIDAGWYDDTVAGDWWPSVGEWVPSVRRFPDGGLARVVSAIREAGMGVGIWLEPEVIGVDSPLAKQLPDGAFLQRHGQRVTEHQRYFLDLRHPAARAHLDATFDRLIATFGIDFFKLDYNVTPGPGTDFEAFSVGAGLLGHNRAHLEWFTELRRRHPNVIFENCSSGAMRADFAMLELFDFQSTSDQEDFRLYPAIAAGAPVQMLPEQAGNWAYPQSWMTQEEIAYTMVTGLSGRLYASGYLNRMNPDQLELVHDAYRQFKAIRNNIAASTPSWPAGLPQWYADTIALVLSGPEADLLYVWNRGDETTEISLGLGTGVTAANLVEIYPRTLARWDVTDSPGNTVLLRPGTSGPTARVYAIQRG